MQYKFGARMETPLTADPRDYTTETPKIKGILDILRFFDSKPKKTIDGSKYRPPIVDQGPVGRCTAYMLAYMVLWWLKKTFNIDFTAFDVIRNFTYFNSLVGANEWPNDVGSTIPNAARAARKYGFCPIDNYFKGYSDAPERFTEEPPAGAYAAAAEYQALLFFQHTGATKRDLMNNLINAIATMPFGCGVIWHSDAEHSSPKGAICMPGPNARIEGGHALFFDSDYPDMKIWNKDTGEFTVGAFAGPNSYGTEWGDNGVIYVPHEYVRRGLLFNPITMLKAEWADPDIFKET